MRAAIIILLLLIANALFGATTRTHSNCVVAAQEIQQPAAVHDGAASPPIKRR